MLRKLGIKSAKADEARLVSRKLIRMWVNFARTGVPTPRPGTDSIDNVMINDLKILH